MKLNLSQFRIWAIAALTVVGTFSGSAQQSNRAPAKDFSAFQIINDRNIFDPNRRPRVQQGQRSAPRVQQIVDSFSLVGTMSYSNLLLAFFDGTSSEYRKSLEVGGKIAGYSAMAITYNTVTLKSGTNEIVLKVGMQMRRSEDGSWAATDAPASSYTSNGGRNSNSNERRSESGRNRYRNNNGSSDNNVPQANPGNEVMPPGPAEMPPPPDNLDPNDPVARLMLRRLQEEGGAPPPAPVENQSPVNPPGENPQNENPDTITNNPVENTPNAQPER